MQPGHDGFGVERLRRTAWRSRPEINPQVARIPSIAHRPDAARPLPRPRRRSVAARDVAGESYRTPPSRALPPGPRRPASRPRRNRNMAGHRAGARFGRTLPSGAAAIAPRRRLVRVKSTRSGAPFHGASGAGKTRDPGRVLTGFEQLFARASAAAAAGKSAPAISNKAVVKAANRRREKP